MVIKEKNKLKPTFHTVYYCDYCCKKIVRKRGEYMYILRRNAKEKTKHFCCYQCRSDYLKSEKREISEQYDRSIRYI